MPRKTERRKTRSDIHTIHATDLDPSEVVQVAVQIKKLNQRQLQIESELSKMGQREAVLNNEYRKIQLDRAKLQRRFDSVSSPSPS